MLFRDVAPGIHRIEDSFVNWYLVEADDGVTIVDAGLPRSFDQLGDALRALGRSPDDVRALLLTHAHFDHVGFAARASNELRLIPYLHEADEKLAGHPLFYGSERPTVLYLANPKFLRIFGSFMTSGALLTRPVRKSQRLVEGPLSDVPGNPVVIPTPGHTHGHVAFHFPERDAIIVGDAFVTLDPYTAAAGPRLVARAATADVALARQSLQTLAGVEARVALTGHGEPWTDGCGAAAEKALAAPVG